MARALGIGHEDFAVVRETNNFYIDKTEFIREWWEANDRVTLITRPGRFGKTLNMSMVENFFSLDHAGRDDLFEGLRKKMCYIIEKLYNRYTFLLEGTVLNEKERLFFHSVRADMEDYAATSAPGNLIRVPEPLLWQKGDYSFGRIRYTHAGGLGEWILGRDGFLYEKPV